jgi:4-amino-4-deoxy-L-arabinose transferase-like glycosyltransferase
MFDWRTWQGAAILLAVLLAICLFGIARPLWTPDEPREAEISREMLLSPGVVPTLNGRSFIEKPPLYYWTVAGVFATTGHISPATARSVSAMAAFLTLVLVFLWGRREFSAAAGGIAALGLATSTRFMISTHWVLIDPLLMLFTTVALWAGWELVKTGGRTAALGFYGALALALWTKGLIGPVLIGCGLAVYCLAEFKNAPWRRLRLGMGFTIMLAAATALVWAIYADAGSAALREWFWVNHVERFVDPQDTGHERPIYYYLWAIPVALLPWWIVSFESLRPRNWWSASLGAEVKRYWVLMPLGMALILSASVTKREIYLLPLLPPLFLVAGAHIVSVWKTASPHAARGFKWWLQVALCAAFASGPVAVVIVYLRDAGTLSIAFLAALAAILVALVVFAVGRRAKPALLSLGACAIAGVVGLMVVVPHIADAGKNMAPFLTWMDERLPAGEPVYVVGHFDETIEGIVPFTTGRSVVKLAPEEIATRRPDYLLIQDTDGRVAMPRLPESYRMVREQIFGTERYLALWQASSGAARGNTENVVTTGVDLE